MGAKTHTVGVQLSEDDLVALQEALAALSDTAVGDVVQEWSKDLGGRLYVALLFLRSCRADEVARQGAKWLSISNT